MAIPLHRKLTLKSTLGFGKYGHYTMARLIELGRQPDILSAYFCISNIDFNDEMLGILNLTDEYRIEKPGTTKEALKAFLKKFHNRVYKHHYEAYKEDREINMIRESRGHTKGALQYKNQKR